MKTTSARFYLIEMKEEAKTWTIVKPKLMQSIFYFYRKYLYKNQ